MKKFKTIYLIKGIIILLFLFVTYFGVKQVIGFYSINSSSGDGIDTETLSIAIFNTKFLRSTVLVGIALLGALINNEKGWLLIITYLYFVVMSALFTLIISFDLTILDLLIYLTFILLVSGLILLMNTNKIFVDYYKQAKSKRFKKNTIGLILGIGVIILHINY